MSLFTVSTVYLLSCVYFSNASFVPDFGYHEILHEEEHSTERLTKINTYYIEQPVDHFNESDKRTFQMMYYEALELWKPESPVYIYISGNQPADPFNIQKGQLNVLAQETGGALYLLEHRYYGSSVPFKWLTTENLAYVSTRQALADIADFITYLKSLPQYKTSKVVVAGAGYAGNLAAWIRLKNSELVDAAIASSAPVLAKVNYPEFFESVGESYRLYGTPGCYENIAEYFTETEQMFKTIEGTWSIKKNGFMCLDVDYGDPYNVQAYFLYWMYPFMKQLEKGSIQLIKDTCPSNITSRKTILSKNTMSMPITRTNCLTFTYDGFMTLNFNISPVHIPWYYQVCNEFANFPTTMYSDKHPFNQIVSLDVWFEMCAMTHGINKTTIIEGVKKTNDMYGGQKPNVSHVVFVNGDLDPWHKLGVLEDISEDAPAILIHATERGRDLKPDSPEDSDELKQTRKHVRQLIKEWIGVGEQAAK